MSDQGTGKPVPFIMPKLVWSSTGDEINLIPYNQDFYRYFVDNLNSNQVNQYKSTPINLDLSELEELIDCIGQVFTEKFKLEFLKIPQNILDQNELNQLHRNWVNLHFKYPKLKEILKTVNVDLVQKINRINKSIHDIEKSFDKLIFDSPNHDKNFQNIFGKEVLTFDTVNIFVEFNNLGRSTYNKWINFDDNVLDIDTNDYKEIYTQLIINFKRPCKHDVPIEYQNWTTLHDTQPFGRTLALANFDNLQTNLLKYRQIFYQNLQIENNYFTLKE